MSASQALELVNNSIHIADGMPAMTIEQAVNRYNQLVSFVGKALREGSDYGKIPGTDKNTLLKPGAEKLCTFFGLMPQFTLMDKTEDWDKPLFYYRYLCTLMRGDEIVASAEASCNSREKKYRWRNVPEWKATDHDKAIGRKETRKGKGNKQYTVYVIENDEIYDLVNTLQKMAQKRALVAAALIAVNASEFFTQDVEDMAPIDAEVIEETPADDPKTKAEVIAKIRAHLKAEDLTEKALGKFFDRHGVASLEEVALKDLTELETKMAEKRSAKPAPAVESTPEPPPAEVIPFENPEQEEQQQSKQFEQWESTLADWELATWACGPKAKAQAIAVLRLAFAALSEERVIEIIGRPTPLKLKQADVLEMIKDLEAEIANG